MQFLSPDRSQCRVSTRQWQGRRLSGALMAMAVALLVPSMLDAAFKPRTSGAAADGSHVVQENGITVVVEGADEKAWDELKPMLEDQLTLSGGSAPAEPLADDLAFFARQQFIREGWPEADVRWELKPGTILLRVMSGVQIRVGVIHWEGELILPQEELQKYLLRPSVEKEGAHKRNPAWVIRDLQTGTSLVQRRLRAEGYLQAEALMIPADAPDSLGMRDITMKIKAGPRFVFGSVNFTGGPPELDKLTRAEIKLVPGSPFNEARVQQIEGRLTSIASERGWLRAQSQSNYVLGKQGGTVDVTITMQPGERIRIARVLPHEDLSKGSRRVLNASFRGLEGQYYSAAEMDVVFRSALDTGMFARLDVDPKLWDGTGQPYADLVITGEESKPKTLGFEVGFDTFLGAQAGITYRDTNFYNSGDSLAAELNWSNAGPLGSIKLTDPAIFNTRFAASVQLAVENFNRFEYSRYGSRLSLELARRVTKAFSYTVFVGANANTVSTEALTAQQLGPDNYTLASLGASFMWDHRDSPVLPKKGWYVSGRLESNSDLAGSNVSFMRTDLRGAFYRPITKKFRFAAGAALMSIQGATAEELPIDSRVFNGGPNSVRAFAERELGPVTPGDTPLGGTSAMFANAEFSYEIYNNLEFALFGDIGSLGRGSNSSLFDVSSDFRPAIGAGLRYRLPFGPIRMDYGHNLDRRLGEKRGMLHITVGFAF